MKKFIKYTLIGSLCFAAVSCSDQEAKKDNPSAASASYVPSNMVMNGAVKWTMDNIYDVWFSGRQCLLYAQQWSQRNYTEEDRYQIRESVNSSYFKYMYMSLNNFQKVINMNTDEATKNVSSAYGANS